MIPSREDVLRTLYTLVNEDQLRLYACAFARFPLEHLPGCGASLAEIAAAVVDTATPEVWAKFVSSLAAERPNRAACIECLRGWTPGSPPRSIFAAVALDGSGVWAIGDTEQEARTGAVDRRAQHRHEAKVLKMDFPPPETDAAWLDTLALITLSGTTESLRALIKSMETGDPVIPWCPLDLWDSPSPVKEP